MKLRIFIILIFLFQAALLVLFGLILLGVIGVSYEIHQDKAQTQELIEMWQRQIEDTAEFKAQWREFMDRLQVEEMTATAYAPLDPDAVEGMCYSGNPYETATGARTTPGRTIAVDPDVIPMGARVYIPGVGVRVAEDVGGLIKGNRLDLCMWDRETALRWGVKGVTAVWVRE